MDRTPTQFLNQLNKDYLAIHRSKEDLFWSTYMAPVMTIKALQRLKQIGHSF
ncbi:hypothetical protein JCM19236_6243 [Vibrio sp. JCM 19236]|nr:hypothetical protein JCM19236_6243 [Vibrio sp. JCM 19236]